VLMTPVDQLICTRLVLLCPLTFHGILVAFTTKHNGHFDGENFARRVGI
jgi:hypothetical protein